MELVYLWVHNYKNIQKQGFNFSPRFTCEYDDETKELTIDENDDYIENFFGDNINVTAIVGKNGSGKSSVLEAFHRVYFQEEINRTIILLLIGKYLYIKTESFIRIINNTSYEQKVKNKCDFKEYITLYTINMNINFKNNLLINSKTISEAILFNKNFQSINIISFFEKIKEVSFSENIEYKIDLIEKVNKIHLETSSNWCEYLNGDIYDGKSFYEKVEVGISGDLYYTYIDLLPFFQKSSNILELYILYKLMQDEKSIIVFLLNLAELVHKYNAEEDFGEIPFSDYIEILNTFSDEFDTEYFQSILDLRKINLFNSNNDLLRIKEYTIFLEFNYFNTKNSNFNDLSDGEKQLLGQFIMLHNQLLISNKEEIVLCLDEPEGRLHPQWQKEYLSELINSLSIYQMKKIHIILTSHSPFLLSDIPKQNIIFLDKDEKGNCKVVDGLKEKKQTFGANIHTLLSDSFFMEGGLMGEFAKGKIDEAIKLLNQDKLDEKELKYCEQIISIIGEPIVKNQLQRMLDSKRLKKIDEIDAIKKSMIEMQQRLDELEK